ncbi:hypothetical protein [Halocatena marina]|uniref:Uncharacterized protein n=1 Tax=Halocatena marina TaxID=2934937 RepID=A0ABD5YNY9_9EURY|nr:hypothetical protein [Halocatena marina]
MRIRDWQDILTDVVESSATPDDWRAVAGNRQRGVGEDMYLGHPDAGVFHLKTYAKNPFEVKGVGGRVARRIDDDLDPLFPTTDTGRFGVQSPIEDESQAEQTATELEEVIKTHADAPTTPDALFEDVMGALDSPAYGPIEYDQYDRPEQLDELGHTFEEAEELLERDFKDIIGDDGVDRGFQ